MNARSKKYDFQKGMPFLLSFALRLVFLLDLDRIFRFQQWLKLALVGMPLIFI